ncbi:MAG: asparagine synthase-related protein, partial [Rhodospirillales bacterium]|nr:asparagine synthase-related protein [Rhodospirillales bacterium]
GIAIMDARRRQLVLARDRLGIVPLYHHRSTLGVVFGSEIKAILRTPVVQREVDPLQLAAQIALPYKLHYRPDATLYDGIKPVLPGQYLLFDLQGTLLEERFYWRADNFRPTTVGSFVEARERLRELLVDAVRLRLRSDRKLAFIVSGGVDSPAVLGIARKLFNVDTKTFSLDLPDERFNENGSIRQVLRWLGLPDHFIPVTSRQVADLVAEVVAYSDEPLATPNGVLHGIMARAINDAGVKVVLNGVGGDEAFFGYHDHFLYHLRQLKQDGDRRFESEIHAWHRVQRRPYELFDDFCSSIDDGRARHNPDFLARAKGYDYRPLLRSDFRETYLDESSLYDIKDHSPTNKQVQDLTRLTIPHSIRMDDNCYLAQAVEARQPFLDHRLIEFGLSLPATFKICCGVSKFVLRQAVRGLVPDERRRDTRKIGLNLPIDAWMKNELKGWVEDCLRDTGQPLYEFADRDEVDKILRQHFEGRANHSLKIWDLCSLSTWLSRPPPDKPVWRSNENRSPMGYL